MKTFDCLDPSISLEGTYALEASAGTGKTFAIEHIASRLILQNIPLKEILIVTFTRAATRELKTRIRSNLETLFENPPPYITELAEEKKVEAQFLIQEALALFDEAQVFTIHGFCQRMLSEFGFEAKVDLNLLSEEEEDYREHLKEAVSDFFHTSLFPNAYSARQLEALFKQCNFNKEKLVQKVIYFIEQKGEFPSYPDYEASEKNFLEIYEDLPKISLETLLKLSPAFLKICTRQGELKEEYVEQFKALSSPDHFEKLLSCRPSLFSFFTEENRSRKSFAKEELKPLYILHEKLHALIEEASNPQHTLIRIASAAKEKARQTLLEKELFSPDDLLLQMEKALKHPTFLSSIHSRYQAVIIDEFQDTDTHQWNIFKTLFVDEPIKAFYIVGDPKQSIYGFRNADLNTYLRAKKEMNQIAHLTTNYRSEPKLLDCLNKLFSKQKHFPYIPVQSAPKAKNTPFNDGKNPLHFFIAEVEKKREKNFPSNAIENDYFFSFIAREIQTLITSKEATFKDFAVLVKDRYQAARLKNYLEALHIPVAAKSTEPLIASPLFSFFKAYLKALIDPKMAHHLLAHPLFSYSHEELKTNESLLISGATFCHHLNHLFHTQGFHKTIDAALSYPWKGKKTLLELLAEGGKHEPYSDFMGIAELLIEHATKTKASLIQLDQFLTDLPSDKAKYCRRPLSDLNAVTIMTIHMSKGLEFPIVFPLGLVNRYVARQDFILHQKKWFLFDQGSTECQSALQEQESEKMRQLYVALTRAKKRLYIPILIDTKKGAVPLGTGSPLELFLGGFPPLDEVGASHTLLQPGFPEPLSEKPPLLQAPKSPIFHFPNPAVHSFSSLAAHKESIPVETPEGALPKGTETGLLLHALLEQIIRDELTHPYQAKKVHELVTKAIKKTSYYAYEKTIINLIDKAFHHPIDHFCLTDVPAHHLHPEVEFLFAKDKTQSLKGFADLIFFHEGKYYILDWKTNLLEGYETPLLENAMKQNDYFLQADIYLEALQKHLNFKRDPHPVVGAVYLFLRGLPEGKGAYFVPTKLSRG